MFRGINTVSIDNKGRLAIPSRYRDKLMAIASGNLVQTLNPLDRSIWIYPLSEWERVETKLVSLSDFDKQSRRTKQMMRGYASDCQMDAQGRILLPLELRKYAEMNKQAVIMGQGNKFEVWDQKSWELNRDQWLDTFVDDQSTSSEALKLLSL